MGDDARQALEESVPLSFPPTTLTRKDPDAMLPNSRQARLLQASLLEILDRVDAVKAEHEKLEGGNKFLQSYVYHPFQKPKPSNEITNIHARQL